MADREHKDLSGAAWLRERTEKLAQQVVNQHYTKDPSLNQKYGEVGRMRCLEDATSHLCFLTQAAEVNDHVHFVDYVRWAKPMLATRNIPWEHLQTNLEILRDVIFEAQPPQHVKDFSGGAISAALRILPSTPDEIPSLVDETNPDHQITNAYLRALLNNDRIGAYRIARDYVEQRNSIGAVFTNVLGVAQKEIGRLWQLNLISVAQEHYCTAATEVIMARISERLIGHPRPRSKKVVGICPPNEEHCVGLQMICELLELEGWPTYFLGAKVPLAVTSFIASVQPTFVLISAATSIPISELKALIAQLKQQVPTARIIVGGRLFENGDPELYKKLGADAFGKDANEAVLLLEKLAA